MANNYDLAKLAAQGRAYSPLREFTDEENKARIDLEQNAGEVQVETVYDPDSGKEKKVKVRQGLQRTEAAEWVRNGVLTVEAYDKAVAKGMSPKSLEEIHEEAEAKHQKEVEKNLGLNPKTAKEPSDDEKESVDATDNAALLASENDIDLKTVKGTGANGRILVKDVEAAIDGDTNDK